jgi:AbrB family looped-hinge helix DNA binding protein
MGKVIFTIKKIYLYITSYISYLGGFMSLVEIRSATITDKGQIVIPKSLRKYEGFSEGSKIAILTYKDHIELRPIETIEEKLFPLLASEKVLAKDWNSKEDKKAWAHL